MSVSIKNILLCISIFITSLQIYGQSQTPYVITDYPVAFVGADSMVAIRWVGGNVANQSITSDSGVVYFSKTPGGSIISNYTDSIKNTFLSNKKVSLTTRETRFMPSRNGMTAGIYYLIVGCRKNGLNLFSNEVRITIESEEYVELSQPTNSVKINNTTPTFSWESNAGVPYYHIIVSDEKITPDANSNSIEGVSVIWEAITPNTQIRYGDADPSGNITTDAPPLSPGKTYSWLVFNNYGNHPIYSSTRMGLPYSFTLDGVGLKKPQNDTTGKKIYDYDDDPTITFKWTNLDEKANTYKIFLYLEQDSAGIEVKKLVWSKEVAAGDFKNSSEGRVTINAHAILTNSKYAWRVMAIDSKGAGTSGDLSHFRYRARVGELKVITKEVISIDGKNLTRVVPFVEVKLEALEGSLEAPLLFYTDDMGVMLRERPIGTYRLTTHKKEFEDQVKTVTLSSDQELETTFYLKRPKTALFGQVTDLQNNPLNIAQITAVSENSDTVIGETDPLGSFILNAYPGDWTIRALKFGYEGSIPIMIRAKEGEPSVKVPGAIKLRKNTINVSGVVRNNEGEPLQGVKIGIEQNGITLATLPSTPQDGRYSVTLASGEYTIVASRTGFTTLRKDIVVTNSMINNLVLSSGASIISGVVYGKHKGLQNKLTPITKAKVRLVKNGGTDTLITFTDAVYGEYSFSVEGNSDYKLSASSVGFTDNMNGISVKAYPGKTTTQDYTLDALGGFRGQVRLSQTSQISLNNTTVSLIDVNTFEVIGQTTVDQYGFFEFFSIPNRERVLIAAGKNGLMASKIELYDSGGKKTEEQYIAIKNGVITGFNSGITVVTAEVILSEGLYDVSWLLLDNNQSFTSAKVNVVAPFKYVSAPQVGLQKIGSGFFISRVDVDNSAIIDCYYRRTNVINSNVVDTIHFPLSHGKIDTVNSTGGNITLSLKRTGIIDSVFIFYKNSNSPMYQKEKIVALTQTDISVTITPQEDGPLEYYFHAYQGETIFSNKLEPYRTYIRPNAKVISRVTLKPTSDEVLLLPLGEMVKFSFHSYYSKKFYEITNLDQSYVKWDYSSTTCEFIEDGLNLIVQTPNLFVDEEITITGSFVSQNGYSVQPGVSEKASVTFRLSQGSIDSMYITQLNDDGRGYITTASGEYAEFSLVALDKDKKILTVTPEWQPVQEGSGSFVQGIYKPVDNFVGAVQIEAKVQDKIVSFHRDATRFKGLPIRYIMKSSDKASVTVSNYTGLSITLPERPIGDRARAELAVETPVLNNDIYHESLINSGTRPGVYRVVSDIYTIIDIDKAIVNKERNLATLTLDIPDKLQDKAANGNGVFVIAQWNDSILQWSPLWESQFSADRKNMFVPIQTFGKYSLIHKPQGSEALISVKPNPFSPLVKPVNDYPKNAQFGTCIEVTPYINDTYTALTVEMGIYNMLGQRVWSVVLLNAQSGVPYKVWWDGKTTRSTIHVKMNESLHSIIPKGEKWCRNGRYILVCYVKDGKSEKRYKKQIILFK